MKEFWRSSLLSTFLCLIAFFFFGCGQDSNEEYDEAILSANILLSQSQCQPAINILETAGRDLSNARYLQTLASAYACRAGFSEPVLFGTDIPKFGSPAVLGGLTRFTTSDSMDAPDNDDYADLQTAIDLLLYAGGTSTSVDPTLARRAAAFSAATANDINVQLLYMILAQLGKYLHFYGNASAAGVKGNGDLANTACLVSYENVSLNVGADIDTFLGLGNTGNCNDAGDSGSSSLGSVAGGNLNIARLCQGVVLLNNFLVIFPSVIANTTGDDFNNISISSITTAVTSLVAAKTGVSQVTSVLSQAKCVSENTANDDLIQVYFALLFESMFI